MNRQKKVRALFKKHVSLYLFFVMLINVATSKNWKFRKLPVDEFTLTDFYYDSFEALFVLIHFSPIVLSI